MARPIAHGGGLLAARRRYPNAPQPWLDLSTGINPIPYPIPALPPEAFTRLPEPETVAAIEAVAAATYGARDPAMVVAAPGTQSLIHLLPRLLPTRRVAVVGPTYAEHAAAWALAGSTVSTVPSLAEAGDADLVVLCNPNNPDGRLYDAATLASARRSLVVDEAFADFDGDSLAASLPVEAVMAGRDPATSCQQRIVLRSFGKTYGLAGIRLGFAITTPSMAARIREALGPWAVSGPALHIGAAALADTGWRHAAGARLAQDAARLDAILTDAGCLLVGGTRLFRLMEHTQAAALADRLAQAGILVRSFTDAPHRLRFGIPGDHVAWSRLAAALPQETPC